MTHYGYFKHDELSGYAIAHHGILGQKWGIRRFQNEDGSLTDLGKKRYTKYGYGHTLTKKGERKLDSDKFNAYVDKKNQEKLRESMERSKTAYKSFDKVNMIGGGAWGGENTKRTRAAAELGLKALKKIGRYDNDSWGSDVDPKQAHKWDLEWFVYEDQTIGLPTVCDLVLQGYSKEKIQKLISDAYKINYYDIPDTKPGVWELQEGLRGAENSGFLDAAIEIHNKEKKK